MKKFAFKVLLIALPFMVLVGLFFITDPFRIVYSYRDYSENMNVIPNRDFVSTSMYLKNKKKYEYNAFIFGSSRTVAYKTNSWKSYLPKDACPFVFDASGESIFGIYTKLKYLDRTNANLKHCLLIIDEDCTFAKEVDHDDHLGIKHPTIAGTSWLRFYSIFLRAYFDNKFLMSYYHFLLSKQYSPSMHGYIESRKIKYDTTTNDLWIVDQEKELSDNPTIYYQKRASLFYKRPLELVISKPQISVKQCEMLQEMMDIFEKHRTDFRIVISPLYAQIKFNPTDLVRLKTIFGTDAVYDFSGINSFTNSRENYFEASHYRPFVGDSIMQCLYASRKHL